ncbi:MAG: hypothetical protein R3C11_13765 [Planctomycetaceae bacterium]
MAEFVSKVEVQPEEIAPVEGTRQRILCELYTSTPCEPCIVPDLAIDALHSTLSEDEFLLLTYHNHKGGPDPLANPDTLKRHASLQRLTPDNRYGSPMITLNGKLVRMGGAFLEQIPQWQSEFLTMLQPLRSKSTPIKLSVTAHAENKQLTINATSEGLVPPLDNIRLKLALAEEEVYYVGSNGIRTHHMVVRYMPGGTNGITATGEQFSHEEVIDLPKIKEELLNYIEAFEQQSNYQFGDKPMHLKKMYVVGFIQNEENNEILQSVKVPVTGELDYGLFDEITGSKSIASTEEKPESTEPEAAESEKPTDEATPAEKPAAAETEENSPAEPKAEEPPAEAAPEESAPETTKEPEPAEEPAAADTETK